MIGGQAISRIRRAVVAATLVTVAAGALAVSGCARDSRQTTVVTPDEVPRKGLTPLERGRIRGEVLRAARPAVAAWRAGDIARMRRYFSTELVDYNAKVKADYARAGKVRVRKHSDSSIDVVELTPNGREASVQYTFTNHSYFANRTTGRPLTKPVNEEAEIDMVVKRTAKGWIVTRMFSGRDELL